MKIIVIGAGPGGYVAAIRAAQMGADVTVVETDEVGGTCLNRGCIPTKALLASTEALSKIKKAADYGLEISGEVTAKLDKIMARKDKVVATQVKGIRGLFKSWGVKLLEGRGRLIPGKKVELTLKNGEIQELEADAIIIATGSRPAQIPVFPFDGEKIISSDEALSLQSVPKSLLIVGAGVIGCEFAFIYKELGTDVTMVEMMPRAVFTEDTEMSEILERELKKKKIKLLKNIKTEKVEVTETGVKAFLSDGKTIEGQKMLVSIGRAVNSENLGLAEVGVKLGGRGEIPVDERMQTNVDDIYAIGDVTGNIMLAHVASKQGLVAVDNIMGHDAKMSYDVVPAAIFTHPEIGSVGLREHQCEEKGIDVKIGRFQFRALGKAHAMGEIAGMIKVIAEAATDKILGVHIIGPHASDLVHEAALAMQMGVTAKDIAETIHAHPTLAEGVMEACEDVHGMAVHMPKK